MKTGSFALLFGLAFLASGCGELFKGKEAADQGVADFHRRYNDGKLTEIYAAGHSQLKSATKEQVFVDFVAGVRHQLGKVTHTSNTNFNIQTTNHNFNVQTTVILIQNTTFERGKGAETFRFEMNGDKAELVDYHIKSKGLPLK